MLNKPEIAADAFVAKNATVLGNVTLAEETSVYFGAVLRAERAGITVGRATNIQDNCVCHTDTDFPLTIGEGCTIGHGAILHGCTVGDNTLIGMGAIVLNGAVIGSNCIVAAGALVTQGAVIPDGSLVMGSPAKVKREVTEAEQQSNRRSAELYRSERLDYMGM